MGEFLTATVCMQTIDFVLGLHNCFEFSQHPQLVFNYQAVQGK